jgi:secreted trypsin-like serine protease
MIGGHNWKKNKPKATVRNVSQIINHENYWSKPHDNDISLIKLKTPVNCRKKIQVACVTTNEPFEDNKCTVSGWGAKSNGTKLKFLRKANVPIVLRSQCNEWYSGDITDNMLCAGFENKGSCTGDSGGPLVKKGTNELVGVASWGAGCAGKKTPGVYTNVANYYNWINQNCENCLGGAGETTTMFSSSS